MHAFASVPAPPADASVCIAARHPLPALCTAAACTRGAGASKRRMAPFVTLCYVFIIIPYSSPFGSRSHAISHGPAADRPSLVSATAQMRGKWAATWPCDTFVHQLIDYEASLAADGAADESRPPARAAWTLEVVVAAGDAGKLTVGGAVVSAEDVQSKHGGTDFTLKFGANEMAFASSGGAGDVTMTINGKTSESLSGLVHLDLNDMAVCIGEKCLMWA